jgi:hypothetical protein
VNSKVDVSLSEKDLRETGIPFFKQMFQTLAAALPDISAINLHIRKLLNKYSKGCCSGKRDLAYFGLLSKYYVVCTSNQTLKNTLICDCQLL